MRLNASLSSLQRHAFLGVALIVCLALHSGCALLRIPLPPITLDFEVFEDETLPGLPRIADFEPRLGLFGLEIPFPSVCEFGDAEMLARAYIQGLADERLGELANNIAIDQVFIERVTLTASEGNFDFLSEAGIRFRGEDGDSTYWSTFIDRNTKQELVFEPDEAFDIFDLLPGEDECIGLSLLYSGAYPSKPVTFSMEIAVRIRADWRF